MISILAGYLNIYVLTFVRVKPMNPACTPSTAVSNTLINYATEASPKKDAQVLYITLPDAAVHSLQGGRVNPSQS